jgi:hypothetical protein
MRVLTPNAEDQPASPGVAAIMIMHSMRWI